METQLKITVRGRVNLVLDLGLNILTLGVIFETSLSFLGLCQV